jgi:hypothetical protein
LEPTTMPAGEFDGIAVRVRFKPGIKAHGGITLEDRSVMAYIDDVGKYFMFSHLDGARRWVIDFEKQCGDREEYNLVVIVADGEYRAYLDGVEMCRVKTPMKGIVKPGLQTSHGPTIFDKFQLRKK